MATKIDKTPLVTEELSGPPPAVDVDDPSAGALDHGSLLERMLGDHEARERLKAAASVRQEHIRTVITYLVPPDCWIDQGGRAYIEGQGVMAACQALGLQRVGQPVFEWLRDETTKRRYLMASITLQDLRTGHKFPPVFGTREAGAITDSDQDIKKAAVKNAFHHFGVEFLGLGGLNTSTIEEYTGRPMGKSAGYKAGSRGGKHAHTRTAADGVVRWPSGRLQGKPIPEFTDEELIKQGEWLESRIEDPRNERYRASNQQLLDVLREEMDNRRQGA